MELTDLAHDENKLRALVNKVMNLLFSLISENFFSS
jgi:hypothetical protein